MIINDDIIYHHEKKIRVEKYVKMKNFNVKCKHAYQFENGDMLFVILVLQKTYIIKFYHLNLDW